MDDKKLIDVLRNGCPVAECAQCDFSGESDCECKLGPKAAELMDSKDTELVTLRAQLAEQAALLVTVTAKYETAVRIQCQMTELQHKTETQLAEKEKQIEAAVKALRLAIANHSTDERQTERLMRHYLAEASGPQEAGEVEHGD